jgi:hypothetical protein
MGSAQIRRFAQRRLADALVRDEGNRVEFALLTALKLITLDASGTGAGAGICPGDQSARRHDGAPPVGGWMGSFGAAAHKSHGEAATVAAAAAAAAAAAVREELAAMREEMRREMADVRRDVRLEAEGLRAELRRALAATGSAAASGEPTAKAVAAADDAVREMGNDSGGSGCGKTYVRIISAGRTPRPMGLDSESASD